MSLIDNITARISNTAVGRFLNVGKKVPDNGSSGQTKVNFYDRNGGQLKTDHRVRITPPAAYFNNYTQGAEILGPNALSAIIFPYTPSISYEYHAEYANNSVTHSNFRQYFYQHSSVSSIQISGKFTVQNDTDAMVYISTMHLLRSLTKMLTGLDTTLGGPAGSPPPICRLNAYGTYGLTNIPVAISNFRADLPDSVDYYALPSSSIWDDTMVPIVSTISITLIPMYSRQEQSKFSVQKWLTNPNEVKKGYL
jgi:hypothetical protein